MPETVLSVDGDASLSCARNEVLRKAEFEVIESVAGPDSLKLASEKQPALIVLAVGSPGIDGFAICKRLKADPRTASIPMLHIARPGEPYGGYGESLESGADTYLQEPVEPPVLIAVATALIRASCGGARTGKAEGDAPSNSRLAALIDSIPDEVWFADSQHRFTLANASALREFQAGVSPLVDVEELARSLEVFRADGRPRPVEEAPPLRALRGETVRDQEEIVRTPIQRELRYRQVSASPVRDALGNIVGSVSVVRDITERKRAEQALRASEERFRAQVMASSDVVYRMNPDWSEMRQLRGRNFIANTETPSRTWLQEYIHPDDQARVLAAIHEAIRGKSTFELEHRVLRVDGTLGWTFSRAIPLQDANGEIVEWLGAASDITERKRAEAALRESEDQFRTLANAIPQLCWTANADGWIFWYNQRWYDYTGATPEQMEGWGWQSVHDPEVLPQVMERWNTSIATGKPLDMVFPLRSADGVFRPFLTRVMPVRDSNGEIARWFGTNTDISEQRKIEEVLRESEKRLAADLNAMTRPQQLGTLFVRGGNLELVLGEIVDAAIAISGADFGNIQLLRPKSSNLEIVAQRGFPKWWLDFWKEVPGGQGVCGTALQRGERVIVEDVEQSPIFTGKTALEIQRKAGVRAVQCTPLLGRSGTLLGMFSTHYKAPHRPDERALRLLDLLARQAADIIERAQAKEALAASESRFRALLDSASQGVVCVDEGGRMVLVNAKTEEMFGYTRDGLLGQPLEVMLPERYRAAFGEQLRDYFARPHARVTGLGIDLCGRSKSGGEFPLEVSLSCVEQGGSRLAMALVTDITERKNAEERLRQAQKLESLGLLAGGVAHDFNNLLVGVIGNASLAKEMLTDDHPAAELLDEVLKTGEQAAHLTRQMLAYSGKGKFVMEALDLSALIPEMSGLVRPAISKKVALHLDLAEDLPPVEADRGQVQQVFMNLAINAAEAIGAVEGLITVRTGVQDVDERYMQLHPETAARRPGKYVCLEVRDTGRGMDEATKARVFDPFFSTKFTGRGLGLAAVAGILRGHKGAITVSSVPGQGSCFTVLFPAAERTAAQRPVAPRNAAPQGAGVILVVDDEPMVRQMMKRALERHGYTVLVADGGSAAIDVFRRHPGEIALVVLDLSMPHMSGEEALNELVKIRPQVRVVVSSGYAESEVMTLFQGQRVAGFIQKPFTSRGIAEKVKECIG